MTGIWLLQWLAASSLPAQGYEGKIIARVSLMADGPLRRISASDVGKLIELKAGEPFSRVRVKRTLQRLYSTQIFHDVQIDASLAGSDQVEVSIFLIRRYFLDSIQMKGQLALSRRQVRRELVFRGGRAYSNASLEDLLARLQALYQRNGFYQARIQPRFTPDHDRARLQLVLEIEAGQRALLRDMELVPEGNLDRDDLLPLLTLRPGAPFSQLQLEQDMETMKRRLALHGFLRVYLRDTVTYDARENRVDLSLRIVPRDRTEIRLEGLEGLEAEPEVLASLPLFSRRGSPLQFLESTADELRDHFQKEGYFLAQVETSIEGSEIDPSALSLRVRPGIQYKLQQIRFEGNRFAEDKSLRQIIGAEEAGWFGRGRFSTRLAEQDMDRIRSYYQLRGFQNVQVRYQIEDRSHPAEATLVYHIEEGRRVLIDRLEFLGNETLSAEILSREIQGAPGLPFSPSLVAEDRANLIAAYENRGYREVEVRPEVRTREDGGTEIFYFIQEGPRYLTEAVIVTGNLRTRDSSIRQEVVVSAGEPLSLARILESETNLYNLGIFNRVQVREVPSFRDNLQKNLMVQLEEGNRHTLLYGLGYSSFEGARGTLGITNGNFMGRAHALSLGLRAGATRQRANLSYTLPRLLGRRLPTVLSLTATNEETRSESVTGGGRALRGRPFDEFRAIASTQTERRLSRRESLFFRYNFETVKIDVPGDLAAPLEFFREQETLRLSSVSLSYLNDSRDEPTQPTSGFYLSGDTRLSLRALGSDEDFLRFVTQGQYYRKLFPDLVLASALRMGGIFSLSRSESLRVDNPVPISERFFSGGATSLRGLPQDLAGVLLRDPESGQIVLVNSRGEPDPNGRPVPLGGNALIIANLELRFPLVAFLSGSLFYDAGNVFRSFTDFSAGISNAVGVGLQMNTPVGPIRFDVGYNPNPPAVAGFDRWNFHLTLGQPF